MDDTDQAVAAFLAQGGKIKRLPKRSATGPAIRKIRSALHKGENITFKRGASGRTVTFHKHPTQPLTPPPPDDKPLLQPNDGKPWTAGERKRYRREMVIQGRRLVLHDLRRGFAGAVDAELALAHQHCTLDKALRCHPSTWFKIQASRALKGLSADGRKKLSTAEHTHRLKVAAGHLLPPYSTETELSVHHLG